MRYQSALVLSTLAVGQAAAGNLRHASFHARRSANIAAGPEGVAWNNVVRDAVDYKAATDKITQEQWDAIFASQKAAEATTAAPVAAAQATTAALAKPTTEKASSTSEAAPAKTSQASSGGEGNVLKALGCSKGQNAESPNGSIWKGDSGSKTQLTFTNDADESSAVLCWSKDGMFKTKENAIIALEVAAGSSLTLSIAAGFSGGCGAAYSDSTFHMSGILNESILEFTTAPENPGTYDFGAYDISREVNMAGIVISATGDRQCTSGVKNGKLSCAFGCTDGATSCEATGTYNIIAGAEDSQYCMANGVDPSTGGASGGCQFNRDGDHLKVTYSKNRSWPAGTF
ncbi:hypothetical protein K458DRAFT_489781 [Lentithecium fluviatile CBS 122367]|uniref:Uncharacterized protein n=1 Tax=Lentithecium fluviatile CBS 122367 TaxID=1168545 RepID=A0A6G1IS53_9PLEO|nr:hypothetical protein K458DRAFT_489781 [Lentithecium fluviatile CBS 122367]